MTRSDARKRLNPPADYEWPTWPDIHNPTDRETQLRNQLAAVRHDHEVASAALKVVTEALYDIVSACDCDRTKSIR